MEALELLAKAEEELMMEYNKRKEMPSVNARPTVHEVGAIEGAVRPESKVDYMVSGPSPKKTFAAGRYPNTNTNSKPSPALCQDQDDVNQGHHWSSQP